MCGSPQLAECLVSLCVYVCRSRACRPLLSRVHPRAGVQSEPDCSSPSYQCMFMVARLCVRRKASAGGRWHAERVSQGRRLRVRPSCCWPTTSTSPRLCDAESALVRRPGIGADGAAARAADKANEGGGAFQRLGEGPPPPASRAARCAPPPPATRAGSPRRVSVRFLFGSAKFRRSWSSQQRLRQRTTFTAHCSQQKAARDCGGIPLADQRGVQPKGNSKSTQRHSGGQPGPLSR